VLLFPICGIVASRSNTKTFTDKQIERLKIFIDQAMIAIESLRLFQDANCRLTVVRRVFGRYVTQKGVEENVAGRLVSGRL
jgi:GAF domain-containing protein